MRAVTAASRRYGACASTSTLVRARAAPTTSRIAPTSAPVLRTMAARSRRRSIYFGAVLGLQRAASYPRPPRPAAPPALPAGSQQVAHDGGQIAAPIYFGDVLGLSGRQAIRGCCDRRRRQRCRPGTQVWLGPNRDLEAWLLRPAASARPYPVIIYTHGNGELIDHWVAPFRAMTDAGVAVLLVEYPGYGRSGGRPTRDSISAGIIAAFDFASGHPEIDARRIVAYGRSLGGAAACALAVERPVAALILESTFTSMADLMPRFVPRALVLDPFDSLAVIAAGTEPVPLPCGHNDCPRQWPPILEFLRRHAVIE